MATKKPALRNPKKKKIPVRNLTPRDNASTVAHLVDTIDHNARHSFAHAKEAAVHAEKLSNHMKKFPSLKKLQSEISTAPRGRTIKSLAK